VSRLALVLIAVVLAMGTSACGSDDEPAKSPPAATATATVNPVAADAQAKSEARTAVTELEACFVDEQDYSRCDVPPSTAEVSAADAGTYTITGHSTSGTEFLIEKQADGAVVRTCSAPGSGGCPAGGDW
jgi:hypothetical protein